MNKVIENARKESKGFNLPSNGETCFNSIDGSDVAEWLTSQGYAVINNYDSGRNGWAETSCGVRASTNGYVHFVAC